MRSLSGSKDIEAALQAVGELVASAGARYRIVIVGGAALNLLGVVARTTVDVDILAFATSRHKLTPPPSRLPEPLARAIRTVAADFGLGDDWLNTGPALQWRSGLPRGLESRVEWRDYGGLQVGIAGRKDLIWLKLFAAADQGGAHLRDLIALSPSDEELNEAARWVKTQDANEKEFPDQVDSVVAHVRERRDAAHG